MMMNPPFPLSTVNCQNFGMKYILHKPNNVRNGNGQNLQIARNHESYRISFHTDVDHHIVIHHNGNLLLKAEIMLYIANAVHLRHSKRYKIALMNVGNHVIQTR